MKIALALMLGCVTAIWAAPHVRNTRATKIKSLPVPANAVVPGPLPGKSYFSAKITKDVYYVQMDGSISMFVLTSYGVVVVDAPPAIGGNMSLAIKEVTNLPVTYLIYTHSHGDHIGNANHPMFQNAERVAHEETAKVLRERNDPNRPVPRTTFSGCSRTLFIGGKKFQLDYHGPIHTPGNIFVYLPNEKVLFTADMVTPGSTPYTRLGVAEDIVAYMEAPAKILTYLKDNSYFFLGGHGRLANRQDVLNQQGYLQDLQKNALLAPASVDYMAVMNTVEDPTNGDLVYYQYREAITQKCADLTSQKWGTILGYTDVYGKSNCDVVMIAQAIDYGTNKVIS
jgi:glyoxylase-like metal-dependent hydrolase (beta-lactamase superfamily II)